jgi:hypothetical protein
MLMTNGDAVLMQQAQQRALADAVTKSQLSSWSTGRVLVHDLPDQLSAESLADPLRERTRRVAISRSIDRASRYSCVSRAQSNWRFE